MRGVGGAVRRAARLTFLDGADTGLLSVRRYGRSICRCVLWGAGGRLVSVWDVHGGRGRRSVAQVSKLCGVGERTYGAVMESIFLLRIGSDILAVTL
jgi:hypothetical protein